MDKFTGLTTDGNDLMQSFKQTYIPHKWNLMESTMWWQGKLDADKQNNLLLTYFTVSSTPISLYSVVVTSAYLNTFGYIVTAVSSNTTKLSQRTASLCLTLITFTGNQKNQSKQGSQIS